MAKNKNAYDIREGVSLARLHLDPENPRHDPISDEEGIISQLFAAERVLDLAKDIAAKSGISPLERIGVVEMNDNPGHYIVAEGNRRVCALKVLQDPRKAPTSDARRALPSLAKQAALPDKFSVVVFPDKESARPWLALRHLGAQDGAGIRPWTTAQKSRFSRGSSPDHLALQILDRAETAGWIDKSTRSKIALTTLTRYLSNPVVRHALGLGDRSELKFTHEQTEVDSALRQFVTDALPTSDGKEARVNSRSDATARRMYANELHTRGISPRTMLKRPLTPTAPQTGTPRKAARRAQNPDNRVSVMPPSFDVGAKDKNLARLAHELSRLRPDEGFAFSSNYVLRAVIERVLVLFAKKRGVFKSGMPDHMLVKACHDALEKEGIHRNDLKNMRIASSNEDALHSLHTLGAAVHVSHVPSRKALITVWDNWEGALRMMLDRL